MNKPIKSLSIFCGSRSGKSSKYTDLSFKIGFELAQRGIKIVYGGGSSGLMGAIADGVVKAQRKAIGIIPADIQHLEKPHPGLYELHQPQTMHERKNLMYSMGEGALILPGGVGTMDEFFEYLVWKKIGKHHHPIFLLNAFSFYDPLISLLKHFSHEGFFSKEDFRHLKVLDSIEDFLTQLET